MSDLLIRNVPDEDLDLLDQRARRLGISRVEYVRRQIHAHVRTRTTPVTVDDIHTLGALIADLADPEVMDKAWS